MREEDSEVRSSFEKGDRVVSNGPHAEVVCVLKNCGMRGFLMR